MSPRKVLFQLHWIFGITVGLVLAIVGATGALLSFEQQIVSSLAGDSRRPVAHRSRLRSCLREWQRASRRSASAP
jgi:uncharacterized iron-regulated membrane protein